MLYLYFVFVSDYYSGSDFAFKPALSTTSRALARRRSLSDLMRDAAISGSGRAPQLVEAQRAADDAFRATHTFKPTLATSSKHVVVSTTDPVGSGGGAQPKSKPALLVDGSLITDSRYKLIDRSNPSAIVERVQRYQTERDQRIAAKQQQKKADELKECTFSPNRATKHHRTASGSGTASGSSEPIRVSGLDRFLERKALAAKLESEKRARHEKVFELHKKYGGDTRPFTVPKPFKLATGHDTAQQQRSNKRREQLLARVQQQRMAECTFQPKTGERTNRDLLREVLAASDEAEASDQPDPIQY